MINSTQCKLNYDDTDLAVIMVESIPTWLCNADVLFVSAGSLSAHRYFQVNNQELCCIVVDSGFSFTHIVPYCRGKKMKDGICRLTLAIQH